MTRVCVYCGAGGAMDFRRKQLVVSVIFIVNLNLENIPTAKIHENYQIMKKLHHQKRLFLHISIVHV